MNNQDHQPFRIQSADELPRDLAPQEYLPHWDGGSCLYDDELEDPTVIPAWRQYFAGGSNRMHFVLFDQDRRPHWVEQIGLGGPYTANGPGYGETFLNAYDAFWTAETAAQNPTGGKE